MAEGDWGEVARTPARRKRLMKDHKSAQEPVENDILVVSSGGGRCCVGS